MGWYDDEQKAGWPEWATPPLAWLGCLMAAGLPTGVVLSLWNALLPDATLVSGLVVYGLSVCLMIAAVKPWTIR